MHPNGRKFSVLVLTLIAVLAFTSCEVSPLDNPDGTKSGLAPIAATDKKSEAYILIAKTSTATRTKRSDYVRSKFGPAWTDVHEATWGRNGCDTRNDILNRDLTSKKLGPIARCSEKGVLSGKLADPYTGETIDFVRGVGTSNAVQIDHVMPLSYSWDMGTWAWSSANNDAARRKFANDPLNAQKSDKGPNGWMPSNTKVRCSYSVRFAQVSQSYHVPVDYADKGKMLGSCM